MKSNYSQETVEAWNHAVELAKDVSKHECWRALVAGLLDLRDLCDKWRRPKQLGFAARIRANRDAYFDMLDNLKEDQK